MNVYRHNGSDVLWFPGTAIGWVTSCLSKQQPLDQVSVPSRSRRLLTGLLLERESALSNPLSQVPASFLF